VNTHSRKMAGLSRSRSCYSWRAARRAEWHATQGGIVHGTTEVQGGTNVHDAVHQLIESLAWSTTPLERAIKSMQTLLESFDVTKRGMRCTGEDDGLRPVHLIVVGGALFRLASAILSSPLAPHASGALARLAALAIMLARSQLVEYCAARRFVHSLAGAGLSDGLRRTGALAAVEPPPPPVGECSSDGFLAHCSGNASARELQSLVASLLAHGAAVSTSSLLCEPLLAAAEAEARALHGAGLMHSSTVKNATRRYEDATARGDSVRWLDGSDSKLPALSALSQWLRGELMDAVRGACERAPRGSNPAAGSAPALILEAHTSLPISMLACYPGGGARFVRHVDNSAETPDLRAVTAVLYLNGAWHTSDGGTLRIHDVAPSGGSGSGAVDEDQPTFIEVEPRRGTLVLFWSHRVPHEVMPASDLRFALSLWMCVDARRQQPGWHEAAAAQPASSWLSTGQEARMEARFLDLT
jgi:hypothetical protein